MRIRSIKPEFFKHEELYEIERATGLPIRVAYSGLWCAADREGRFKWRPRMLKCDVLPFDDVDFSEVLAALELGGFVRKYTVAGQEYGVLPSFKTHQHVNAKEAKSRLPGPPEGDEPQAFDIKVVAAKVLGCTGIPVNSPAIPVNSHAQHTTREVHAPHGDGGMHVHAQDGREGKGRERNCTAPKTTRETPDGSIHRQITERIGEVYKSVTGEDFAFNPRFAKRLQVFLDGWNGTAEEWLDRYADVLTFSTELFASECKRAADPVYLCDHWHAVSRELVKLQQEHSPRRKPTFAKLT